MIEIKLTDLEIMIGTLKLQEITQEVTLEGNIPKIIETSMPTTLILDNIIQEIIQEVTPEGDPQISNTGHIVEIRIKDINLGAHSVDMTILGIHTQLEIITDQERDSEMDHTIDPERDSEMDHTIDPERDSEMNHRKDMRIIMIKGINLKKETPHIQKKMSTNTGANPEKKEPPHILGKEIIAKIETTEKETPHIQEEITAITEQEKETPHIQEEEALLETETAPELLHQALTHLQDT